VAAIDSGPCRWTICFSIHAKVVFPSRVGGSDGSAVAGGIYDPALVRAPVAIIRGEWDGMSTEEDAKWLFHALQSSPIRRIVTISRGAHLLHPEESRYALYRETEAFLAGNDVVAAPVRQAA
jgi:hypothetical protein